MGSLASSKSHNLITSCLLHLISSLSMILQSQPWDQNNSSWDWHSIQTLLSLIFWQYFITYRHPLQPRMTGFIQGNHKVKTGYMSMQPSKPTVLPHQRIDYLREHGVCSPGVITFFWRAILCKLPTKVDLQKRKLQLQTLCTSCSSGEDEDLSHIFFSCSYSKELWESSSNFLDGAFRFSSINDPQQSDS